MLRLPPLDRDELLDVGADLEDRRGLDVAGELRIRHLVVPRPERAVRLVRRMVPSEQEVRVAAPRPIEERCLVDDVGPLTHRVDRLDSGCAQLGTRVSHGLVAGGRRCARGERRPRDEWQDRRAILLDLDHPQALRPEVLEIPSLVLQAALCHELDRRVIADGLFDQPDHRGPLQREAMLAGEIAHEVGGGVDGSPVDQLHARRMLRARRATLPVTAVRRESWPGQAGRSDRHRLTAHCQSVASSNTIRIAAPRPGTAA